MNLLLVLLLGAVPPQCTNWPKKPAWEWTVEERLHYRYDRACTIGRRELARTPGHAPDFVDGADTPELFLPSELFDLFLRHTYVSRRSNLVEVQARQAKLALPPRFFEIVRENAGDYLRHLQGETGMDFPADCRARMAALTRVRAAFRGKFFDQFLYTVIAPGPSLSGDDTREKKRWFERGCP
ncbi:MAG TPA: hypothetical protein VIW45_01510 [Vicinamibacterales bacterium]|jgi:hypothetical protein